MSNVDINLEIKKKGNKRRNTKKGRFSSLLTYAVIRSFLKQFISSRMKKDDAEGSNISHKKILKYIQLLGSRK